MERAAQFPPGALEIPFGRHPPGVVGERGHGPESDRARRIVDGGNAFEEHIDGAGAGPASVGETGEQVVDTEVAGALRGGVGIAGHASRVDNRRTDGQGWT